MRVGACLVRGQISFIGLNTLVRIFVIPIIPFFCGESKQDRTQKQATPRAVKSALGVAVILIIILL